MRSPRVRRAVAVITALAVIAAGLAVHLVLPDTAATDIAGDVLYTVLIYVLVVAVRPRLPPVGVGAIAAAWCVAIELFQLTGVPDRLGAAFPPAVLVLGTVFDPRDLVVGVSVSAVLIVLDTVSRMRGRRADPPAGVVARTERERP